MFINGFNNISKLNFAIYIESSAESHLFQYQKNQSNAVSYLVHASLSNSLLCSERRSARSAGNAGTARCRKAATSSCVSHKLHI